MPTRNVFVTEHFDTFIESGIAEGLYTDASEAVCEGLHLLEQRRLEDNAKIEWLRSAAQEGIDSLDRGDGIVFQSVDELAQHVRDIGQDVRKRLAADQQHG